MLTEIEGEKKKRMFPKRHDLCFPQIRLMQPIMIKWLTWIRLGFTQYQFEDPDSYVKEVKEKTQNTSKGCAFGFFIKFYQFCQRKSTCYIPF